ncbi:MAG: hypothetical protein L0241_32480, partial [Planctomycetia bacterium]|nr:hypothetical protein [Planctomycetia bacterium]
MKTNTQTRPTVAIVTVVLPGSDRKRTPAPYHFRVTYRNPEPIEPGCVMTWAITGGREEYQVSAERTESGNVRWHCTCPDAIYRDDPEHTHRCKHVQGLLALLESAGTPVRRERVA